MIIIFRTLFPKGFYCFFPGPPKSGTEIALPYIMTGQNNKQLHLVLAEDEAHARTTLSLIFKKAGYKVTAAENGKKTLEILLKTQKMNKPADILVTDIQMPGMTGIELIDELKKKQIEIPILVITGFGNKDMVIQLMRKGCNDFIEKPFEPHEVLESVKKVLEKHETSQLKQDKMLKTIENASSKMQREIEAYRQDYMNLNQQVDSAVDSYKNLFKFDLKDSNVIATYRFNPLSRLGGDFFEVRNTSNGAGVLVADVAGHDMGAAFHALVLKAFFEEKFKQEHSGKEFFNLLNNHLIKKGKIQRMITAAFLNIDLEKMTVEAAFAGHPPVLKIDTHNHISILPGSGYISEGSKVLGIFDEADFWSQKWSIDPGDRFILYTDGVTNALRVDGTTGKKSKLTLKGLIGLIRKNSQRRTDLKKMVDMLWEDVFEFCRYKARDDMLLLGIEIPGKD